MYVGKVLGIPDRDRVYAIRLRLSSHKLAIEMGRWSRIPREDRLCPCGVIQTEQHVICHCPLSDHIPSQFSAVSFSNIAEFFDCAEVGVVCCVFCLILSIYDETVISFSCVILWDCTFISVCCIFAVWQQCVLFVSLCSLFSFLSIKSTTTIICVKSRKQSYFNAAVCQSVKKSD